MKLPGICVIVRMHMPRPYLHMKGKKVSLVEIDLHTGRSHQIRTQFQYIKHPLLGDARYGSGLYKGGIALESFVLGFDHPTTREHMEFKLDMREEAPWGLFRS